MARFYGRDYRYLDEPKKVIPTPSTIIIGEGGGCFVAGTKVKTAAGYSNIERIQERTTVIGYDLIQTPIFGQVVKTPTHGKHVVKFLLDITIEFKNEEITFKGITDNHALYDPETTEHKLASEFKVGDFVENIQQEKAAITKVTRTENKDLPKDLVVYNLLVEPCHTFVICDENFKFDLKVHNGGGDKDTGGGGAEEAANTLQSDATIVAVELVSQGVIQGIVGEEQGTFINNVPMFDEEGKTNFLGAEAVYTKGFNTSAFYPGFEEVGAVYMSGTVVTQGNPVTHTIVEPRVVAVDITISFPEGLYFQNKTNGNLDGYEVALQVEANGSVVEDVTVRGKSMTSTEVSFRIDRPVGASAPWSFTVVRSSIDDAAANEHSKIAVSRWVEIYDNDPPPNYAGYAMVGLKVPASSVGGETPTRSYLVAGVLVDIPTNFDPILRTFSGIWDGNFQVAWTDDTSWHAYNMIVNDKYGLQSFYEIPVPVNKWSFFDASVFNNELIPDGLGGLRPRFTFNAAITKAVPAWNLIQAIAANMDAAIVPTVAGEFTVIQDRPGISKQIVNNTSVIGGLFNWSDPVNAFRVKEIEVTYNDATNFNLPATVIVDGNLVGTPVAYKKESILAYGCVTESEAIRKGKMRAFDLNNITDAASFQMPTNGATFGVGDIITVVDNDYLTIDNTEVVSGRILSVTGSTVVLDAEVTLTPNATWIFGCASPDRSSIIEVNFTTDPNNVTDTLTVPGLPAGDYHLLEFYCSLQGVLEHRDMRVVKKDIEGDNYNITALIYEHTKWDTVEQGITFEPTNYYNKLPNRLRGVTNIQVIEDNLNDDDLNTNIMRVIWDFSPKHRSHNVTVHLENSRDSLTYHTQGTFIELHNIVPGVYTIEIITTGILGATANPVVYVYNYAVGVSPLLPPFLFSVKDETEVVDGKYVFNDNNPTLLWHYDEDNAYENAELAFYRLKWYSTFELNEEGTPLLLGTRDISYHRDVTSELYRGGSYKYLYDLLVEDNGAPNRELHLDIHNVDLTGRESLPLSVILINPAPPLPAGEAHWKRHTFEATLTPADDLDVTDLLIAAGETEDFEPTRDTWVWRVPADQTITGANFTDPTLQDKFVRSALSDSYNEDTLKWSDSVFLPIDLEPPTNTALLTGVTEVIQEHGFRDITITWGIYENGDFEAENIAVFISTGHDDVPKEPYALLDVNLTEEGKYTFLGQFRGASLRVGVAACRYGVEGLVIGLVSSPKPLALIAKHLPCIKSVGNDTQTGATELNYWDGCDPTTELLAEPLWLTAVDTGDGTNNTFYQAPEQPPAEPPTTLEEGGLFPPSQLTATET